MPWNTAEFGDQVYFLSGGERPRDEQVVRARAWWRSARAGRRSRAGHAHATEEAKRLPSVTLNGGERTRTIRASPYSVAPAGTTAIEAANDGGFAASRAFSAFGGLRRELARTGAERLPKTVSTSGSPWADRVGRHHPRPDRPDPCPCHRDASGKRYTLRLKARDTTSGIATLQVIGKKSRSYLRYSSRVRAVLPAGRVACGVIPAGNWSSTKRIK